jgi:hypothetical protein
MAGVNMRPVHFLAEFGRFGVPETGHQYFSGGKVTFLLIGVSESTTKNSHNLAFH